MDTHALSAVILLISHFMSDLLIHVLSDAALAPSKMVRLTGTGASCTCCSSYNFHSMPLYVVVTKGEPKQC